MFTNERDHYQPRMVIIMSDLDILTATVKSSLLDIAKQANALGTGLQNAAPGEKADKPNNSVQYLLNVSDALEKAAEACNDLTQLTHPIDKKP
jgi:hypothetical protein